MPEQTQTEERPIEGTFSENPETALAVRDEAPPLALLREPELVVAEGRKAARALLDVINSKARKVVLNSKQYLEVDDWTLLGQFYGASAKTAWTRPVAIETAAGKARGWEARVEIIDTRTGFVLSAGEAMCTDNEQNWGRRTKYQWMTRREATDKGYAIVGTGKNEGWVRAKVAEEEVPDASRRSMAQTRATSRALAMRLRWIPVLAGLSGTPAEEMPQYRHGAGSDYEEAPSETAEVALAAVPSAQKPVSTPVGEADKKLIREAYRFFEDARTSKAAHPDSKKMAEAVLGKFKALMKSRQWRTLADLWASGGEAATLAEVFTILGLERPKPPEQVPPTPRPEEAQRFEPDELPA